MLFTLLTALQAPPLLGCQPSAGALRDVAGSQPNFASPFVKDMTAGREYRVYRAALGLTVVLCPLPCAPTLAKANGQCPHNHLVAWSVHYSGTWKMCLGRPAI